MDFEDENDTSDTIFAPEPGGRIFEVKRFDDFLRFLSQKIRLYPGSVTLEFSEREHELITPKEFEAINIVRSKYKHNRTFYSDERRIVVKEMPTAAHSRTACFIQTKLSHAIVAQLLLPNNAIPDDEIITGINDESIRLPHFFGEPDGGWLWDGEDFPFALLEVGYSDSGKKTRGRSIHWLTRGAGNIKFSLSIKIKARNYSLQGIEVNSYKWSNQPLDSLVTRNSIHGRAVHMEKLELVNGNTTTLAIPSELIESSSGRPALVNPLPPFFTVQIGGLVPKMHDALRKMQAQAS